MFTKDVLEAPLAKVDSTQLILGGHSFGGATVLYTSTRLAKEQLKAVWTFDPWMFPHLDEFASGKLQLHVPTIVISSEYFHPDVLKWGKFDSWKAVKDLLRHSKVKDLTENVMIKETGHWHQVDLILMITMDMAIMSGRWPPKTLAHTYMLLS